MDTASKLFVHTCGSRMAQPRACWFAAAWLAVACTAAAAQPSVVAIEVDRTAFRVTLSDGSTKQGTALAGAVLVFRINGVSLRVRLATITSDAMDKSGTVLLHDFRNDDTGAPLCEPDQEGRMLGFPLPGRSASDGRLVEAEAGAFELVCTSGAQGKCVRFGYRPWRGRKTAIPCASISTRAFGWCAPTIAATEPVGRAMES